MARFEVSDGTLWLHLSLLERFGASGRQDFGVLLTTVRSVRVTDNVWSELRGVRAPGMALGRVIALGTRRHPLGRDFVAVYGRGPAVVVDLTGVHFLRLVVSTADAAEVADEIEAAVTEARLWG